MGLPDCFQFKYYKGFSPLFTAIRINAMYFQVSWGDYPKQHIRAGRTHYEKSTIERLIDEGLWIMHFENAIPEDECDFKMDSIL